LLFVAQYGFFKSVLFGLIFFALLGFFLAWAFCTGENEASVTPDLPKPTAKTDTSPPPAVSPAAQAAPAAAAVVRSEPVAAETPKPKAKPQTAKPKTKATVAKAAKPAEPAAKPAAKSIKKTDKATGKPVEKAAPAKSSKAAASPKAPAKPAAAKPAAAKKAPAAKSKPSTASALDAALSKSKDAPVAGQPEMLDKPRGGKADDLKLIKGVGPALEKILNDVGVWHFDQVASWKAKDIAFVDAKMQRFSGRITRDEWVKQAKILAKGGTTEFSARASKGEVY
jgi:predicted flap endonuclease-1-like 5' DNA nuclease